MRPTTAGEVLAGVACMETIQRLYWSGSGADEYVVDALANLRHFCDAHRLDFAQLDQRAYQHYKTEKSEPRRPIQALRE